MRHNMVVQGRSRSSWRRCAAVAAVALVAALAAGCGGSSSDGSAASKVRLEVWGIQDTPGRLKALNELTAKFEKAHPEIDVQWSRKSFNDVNTAIKLALSGPSSPDIAQLPQGVPMATLAKAHLLVPLDRYADKYGWKSRFSPTALAEASATADGTFGKGTLYGVSATTDFVGVYYNRSKMQRLGLKPPATLDEFESEMAAAKRAGEVPIAFGNSDKWPAAHLSYTVFPQFVPKATLDAFGLADANGPSFDTPGAVEAAATLQRWARNGYLTPGYDGITSDQAVAGFLKGKGVFFVPGGSWYEGNIEQANAEGKFGFFLMPPASAGQPEVTVGTGGNPYAISTRSKHPDQAAAFLDFITGPTAAKAFVDVAHDVPGSITKSLPAEEGGSLADLRHSYAKVQDNGLTPWLDWATPSMYDDITANLQKLLAGKMTPQQFAAETQADRTKTSS